LVGAVIKRDGVPLAALRKALRIDHVVLSAAVEREITDVLYRPGLSRFIDPTLRSDVLGILLTQATRVEPTVAISECRDSKDNIYLELAFAATASVIVSSDMDLLDMHPWRGSPIVRPVVYLSL
jgi:putative PIN family toxin of toxin-antitoxin system